MVFFPVEVPNQGKELGEAHRVFLFAINKKIEEKCSMKILKVLDEESRTKMSSLMLANKIDRSNDTNKLTIKDQVHTYLCIYKISGVENCPF